MKYIMMPEHLAINKKIIVENHPFKTGEEKVLFKQDVLTIWQNKGNAIDFEFQLLTTAQALNIIDTWI